MDRSLVVLIDSMYNIEKQSTVTDFTKQFVTTHGDLPLTWSYSRELETFFIMNNIEYTIEKA